MTNEAKILAAIAYLRERGIYLLDGKFKPTSPVATDVAATWARYRMSQIVPVGAK